MTEFGAVGPGYSINDPEVAAMSTVVGSRSAYFVAESMDSDPRLVGGAGVMPLRDGDESTCELIKMYLLPAARGHGLGQRLLSRCLEAARGFGFTRCYLETLESMSRAQELYRRNGFVARCAPLGQTGHSSCNCWMDRSLEPDPDRRSLPR
ncbi:MAG: GNAT family N-acetyltransferase [Deltaproteobacteria bacterium]|nr:GNAT family N-acetyltransferase [Deltaproteobacteria bacterium]